MDVLLATQSNPHPGAGPLHPKGKTMLRQEPFLPIYDLAAVQDDAPAVPAVPIPDIAEFAKVLDQLLSDYDAFLNPISEE